VTIAYENTGQLLLADERYEALTALIIFAKRRDKFAIDGLCFPEVWRCPNRRKSSFGIVAHGASEKMAKSDELTAAETESRYRSEALPYHCWTSQSSSAPA